MKAELTPKSQWQPIETAPMDGTHFCALNKPTTRTYSPTRYWLGEWTYWNEHTGQWERCGKPPTHWMPFPPTVGGDAVKRKKEVIAIQFGTRITNDRAEIKLRMERGEVPRPVYRDVVQCMVNADMGFNWKNLLKAPTMFIDDYEEDDA